MAHAGMLRVTMKLAQWITISGVLLAALGLAGSLLGFFRLSAPSLLTELGVLALPVIFLGLVIFLIVAVVQIVGRKQPPV